MDMDAIRSKFEELKNLNVESPLSNSIYKKSIPKLYESISFMAYPSVVGNQVDELIERLKQVCWNTDVQQRKVFAIVQSFGCGKTKTGLMLAKEFVVLPWRVSSSPLIQWLQYNQKQLYEKLPEKTKISYKDVEQFSFNCLALFASLFRGHIALFNACVENKIVKNNFIDRFYFALMLLNNEKSLIDWIKTWADQFCLNNQKNIYSEGLLFSNMVTEKNVVFVLDEVHGIIDLCRGYSLHRATVIQHSGEESVNFWFKEQIDKEPHPNKKHCTDLFYQLRHIMLISMSNQNLFGFVMCSTEYRTWEHFEVDGSPFSRGIFERFICYHDFTKEQVFNLLLDFFNIEIFIDDTDIDQICSYLVRPYYVAQFMEELFETPYDHNPKRWLATAFEKTKGKCLETAISKIRTLDNNNYSAGTYTSRGMINFLYTVHRLCGGTYQIYEDYETNEMYRLIGFGVGKINISTERFRLNDPIFIEALNRLYSNKPRLMMSELAKKLGFNHALTSHDQSHKGYLTERALSCVILESEKPYPTKALTAGTTKELFYDCFEDSSEAKFLLQVALGNKNYILLPTTDAGPDIWYRTDKSDSPGVVAIQSKCHKDTLNLLKFKEALQSLNPLKMFSAKNAEDKSKMCWKSNAHSLSSFNYYRCIFSAAGFTEEVYYIVLEFNKKNPNYNIFLYNLDDVKNEFGEYYYKLKSDIPEVKSKPKDTDLITQDIWKDLSSSKKSKMSNDTLASYCKLRNINSSNKGKKKKKEDLIKSIDNFDLDEEIKELMPKFPKDAKKKMKKMPKFPKDN